MPDKLRLYLFGSPQITWQGRQVTGFVSNKARALLIYLAVTGRRHSREALAELFWANKAATRHENLKKVLSNLRHLVGITLIEEGQQVVALDPAHYWADVTEFARLANDPTIANDPDALQRVGHLYQGNFLYGFSSTLSDEFETWITDERTRLKEQFVIVLHRLADAYIQRHDLSQAIITVRRLLRLETRQEEAYRCQLMELLARSGNRAAALQLYTEILADLGDDNISASTTELYERILNNEIAVLPTGLRITETTALLIDQLHLPTAQIPQPAPLGIGSIMPLSKNPLFVGREQDLRTLAQALQASSTAAVSQVETAATTGLGGIGKTQLACEFVHRYGQFFPGGVFWLSFDNAESIPAEIASCGGAGALDLRPDFGQRPLTEQVRLVQAAWQEPMPRLLVFDNCEALELLTRWRPTSGGCRVIVTSRRGDWEPALGVQMVAIGVLDRAESLALLRSHCPNAMTTILDAIAEELGDLPLALHLAGSYLRHHPHVAPDAYLAQLRDPQLLQHPSMLGEGFSPTGHLQHVGRTFALSYDRLNPALATDAQAITLLVHAAHFAPGEPIWYRLLVKTLGLDLDNPADAHQADAAFARLIEFGIIEREANDTLRMHRLVARFVRDVARDQVAATQQVVEAVVFAETAAMNKAVRPLPLLAWQLHLRTVADIAQVREDEEGARLCHELGTHLWQIGDFAGALLYVEKALEIREKRLGVNHLAVAESLLLLGRVYRALGKFTTSRPYFERALAIRLHRLGERHASTAESYENLGRCFLELGMLDQSRQHLQRALMLFQQTVGDDHELTAECHNNLAHCLYSMEDYTETRHHLERATAINEKAVGTTHPHIAVNYHNLGALLHTMGNLDDAKAFMARALAIRHQEYGNEHPDTAISHSRMGLILRDLGDLNQAQAYVEQALTYYTNSLGEQHVSTANCRSHMASILQHQGHLNLALTQQEQAYRICHEMLGPEHPSTQEKLIYLNELKALVEAPNG